MNLSRAGLWALLTGDDLPNVYDAKDGLYVPPGGDDLSENEDDDDDDNDA